MNGIFHYACSRNNDFSNRDQKATIIVSAEAAQFQTLGRAGGVLSATSGASLEVQPGAFTTQITVTMLTAPAGTSSSFSGMHPLSLSLSPLCLCLCVCLAFFLFSCVVCTSTNIGVV
jgi:hypothetical protein